MKTKISNNKKMIIITVASLVFILMLIDVLRYEMTSYDQWAYDVFVDGLRSDNMTTIMKIITSFGSAIVVGIIVILLLVFLKNKKIGIISLINIGIVFLLNDLLKFIIHRPRPYGYNLIEETNYSFPSGHSMISTAFYGFLIYVIYKNIKDKKLKYLLMGLLFILIILICISRIYLGVHYFSDTIAGFSLSLVYLMIFIMILPRLEKRL